MRDHRSLICWIEARIVVKGVLRLGTEHWRPYLSALFSQLQRSSLSVQLNIAEGYSLANSGSFLRHITIAYASAVEAGEILELLQEIEGELGQAALKLLPHCHRSQRLLLGMIRRSSKNRRQPSPPAHG